MGRLMTGAMPDGDRTGAGVGEPRRRRWTLRLTPEHLLFLIFLTLVAVIPVPFGGVRPWAGSLAALVLGGLILALAALAAGGRKVLPNPIRRIWPSALALALVAGWAAVQALPMSPEHWHHPLWRATASALPEHADEVASAISLDPFATQTALMHLLTYAAAFWLAFQFGRSSRRARFVVLTAMLSGAAYTGFAMIGALLGDYSGLSFGRWSSGEVASTFVDRHSYAAYATLALLCALALLFEPITSPAAHGGGRRHAVTLYVQSVTERGWPALACGVLLATALVATQSRPGLLAAIIGVVALLAAVLASPSLGLPHQRTAVGIVAAVLLAVLVIGASRLPIRSEASLAMEQQALVHELTRSAIADARWAGTGYGTYDAAIRPYRSDEVVDRFTRGHNDLLEGALELGLPAAFLLLTAIAGLAGLCMLGVWRRRRGVVFPALGIAATTVIAVHSAASFSMQVPAVAVTYLALMGIACAQSFSSVTSE